MARIDALFDIERGINGMPAEDRLTARQQHARPLVEELHDWLMAQRAEMSKHADHPPISLGSTMPRYNVRHV